MWSFHLQSWNICPSSPSSCVFCLAWTVEMMSRCWCLPQLGCFHVGDLRVGRCWRPQTEIKTQNALQELTLCRVVLHPEFCSFLVKTKLTFLLLLFIIRTTNSSRSLKILKFLYPVFVSLFCLIVKNLNDSKNTLIYFVGLSVWSHLTGTVFSLTCFSKIAQKRFFFWYFLWKQPFTLKSAHVLKVRN